MVTGSEVVANDFATSKSAVSGEAVPDQAQGAAGVATNPSASELPPKAADHASVAAPGCQDNPQKGGNVAVAADADVATSSEATGQDSAADHTAVVPPAKKKLLLQPRRGKGTAALSVVVRDFPDQLTEAELVDFFSGAVLSAAGHSLLSLVSAGRRGSKRGGGVPAPCVGCFIDRGRREARVRFRSELAASIAVCLDGIEYGFIPMRVQRPAEYRQEKTPKAKVTLVAGKWDVPLDALVSQSTKYSSNLCTTSMGALWRGIGGGNHLVTSAWCEPSCGQPSHDGDEEEMLRDSSFGGASRAAARARTAASHYETLGVAMGATPAEVRRAYYHKCRELKSKLCVSSADSATVGEFSQIVEAYKTLCNGRLRDAYDQRQLPYEVHSGHLQYDLRAAAFFIRHLGQKPIVRLESTRATAGPLLQALPRLAKESGTDILALSGANQPSHICEILVAGKHEAAAKARALIWDFLHREPTRTGDGGKKAPPEISGASSGMLASGVPQSSPYYFQQPYFNSGGYGFMGWSQYMSVAPQTPPKSVRSDEQRAADAAARAQASIDKAEAEAKRDQELREQQARLRELLSKTEKLLDKEVTSRIKDGSDKEGPRDDEAATENQRWKRRKASGESTAEPKDPEVSDLFHKSNLTCSWIAASLCVLTGGAGVRRTQCDARMRLDIAIELVDQLGSTEEGASSASTPSPSPISVSISPKQFHRQLLPMSPASIMTSIVALDEVRSQSQAWHQRNLFLVLQSAALDLHEYCDLPRCSLSTAVATIKAAGKEPFVNLLKSAESLLMPAIMLRIEVELAEETCMWPSSPDGNFQLLSFICSQVANIFVSGGIPETHRAEIVRVFKEVATECRILGAAPGSLSIFDPEGLCRLAIALALIAREAAAGAGGAGDSIDEERKQAEHEVFSDALTNIACCAIARMAQEAPSSWSAQQLLVLISAFVLLEVKHRALFERVANLAHLHLRAGGGWTPEQLWKLVQSAWQLGLLPTMRGLLRFMFLDGYLTHRAPSATGNELMVFIGAAIVLDCPTVIEVNCKKRAQEELLGGPLERLIEALDAWPNNLRWRGVAPLRSDLLEAAVRVAGKSAAASLCSEQVLSLIRVAASEEERGAEYLRTLGTSPAVLAALPEAARRGLGVADAEAASSVAAVCAELATLLAPFSACQVPTPRLESVCAARLLVALQGASVLDLPVVCTAVRSLATGAGRTLGVGVLAALARLPAIQDAVKVEAGSQLAALTNGGGYFSVFELLGLLLRCTDASAEEATSAKDSADQVLQRWVESVETAARESTSDVSLISLSQRCGSVPALQEAREALGPAWLGALLVRSKCLTWDGGASVVLQPPRLQEAIQTLAEDLVGVPQDKRVVPGGKAWPPALVITYALDNSMLETVGGTFSVVGENHGQPVYKRTCPVVSDLDVILYYWDQRDGPDAQGWWFGPAVGSEEVWLHNRSCKPAPPPRNNWEAVKSGEVEHRLNVLDSKTFASGPWMVDCEDYDDDDDEYDEEDEMGEAGPLQPPVALVAPTLAAAATIRPSQSTVPSVYDTPAAQRSVAKKVIEECAAVRSSASVELAPVAPSPSMSSVAPQLARRGPQLRGSVALAGQQRNGARGDNSAAERCAASVPTVAAVGSVPSSAYVPVAALPERGILCGAIATKDERRPTPSSTFVLPVATPEERPTPPKQVTPPKRVGARSDTDDSKLNEKERKLKAWLLQLDNGSGILLQYFDVLNTEFDGDLSQIAAAKSCLKPAASAGIIGIVDPMFWETVRVQKMGHRMLFAKGIAKL